MKKLKNFVDHLPQTGAEVYPLHIFCKARIKLLQYECGSRVDICVLNIPFITTDIKKTYAFYATDTDLFKVNQLPEFSSTKKIPALINANILYGTFTLIKQSKGFEIF